MLPKSIQRYIPLSWRRSAKAVLRKFRPIDPVDMRSDPAQKNGLLELCDACVALSGDRIIARVAEIGSYAGESTIILADKFPQAQIWAIDPWGSGYCCDHGELSYNEEPGAVESRFDTNTQSIKNRLKKFKGKSTDVAAHFDDGSLDMVYIDGCHEYACVVEDIKAWQPKLRNGGLLCGHDYGAHCADVIRAVDDAIGKPEKVFQDSSWLITIRP
jgi:hypothetical protein